MTNTRATQPTGIVVASGPTLPLAGPGEAERADAVRNRALLLDAASRLIEHHGAAAVTMDAVAREAGVGKGTVFRRFGGRAGLMMALLDHSETEMQRAYISGPPPLGPGAPPAERLVSYGRARLTMVCAHLDILIEADDASGPGRLAHPAHRVAAVHVQSLLRQLGFGDSIATISLAVLAPLEAASVHHLTVHEGLSVAAIGDQWERLVRALICH